MSLSWCLREFRSSEVWEFRQHHRVFSFANLKTQKLINLNSDLSKYTIMTIQQLSILIENKAGTLLKVLDLFKEAGIQLIASTIADTEEYGIYRIICSDPGRAYTALKNAGISVVLSDVFALTLDNQPGRAADAVRILTDAGIGITYMYSFLIGGKGILIFRTNDAERTRETIILNDLTFITDHDLLMEE